MVTCSIDGCDRTAKKRGFCTKHYQKWYKYGDPLIAFRAEDGAPQEFIETALNHQDKETCLYWPFARSSSGYAIVSSSCRSVSRIICEKLYGPPPTIEHQAAHSCGKGHLSCINPHHLRWDTRTGNEADKVIHGTTNRGERDGMAVLTWEQVWKIKATKGTLSSCEVAIAFGVSRRTISRIWSGETWKE